MCDRLGREADRELVGEPCWDVAALRYWFAVAGFVPRSAEGFWAFVFFVFKVVKTFFFVLLGRFGDAELVARCIGPPCGSAAGPITAAAMSLSQAVSLSPPSLEAPGFAASSLTASGFLPRLSSEAFNLASTREVMSC